MREREMTQDSTLSATAGISEAKSIVREEHLDDFKPEWCQKLLNDPAYRHVNLNSRKWGGSLGTSFCSLMSKTLNTDQTIRAMQILYKPPGCFKSSTASDIRPVGGEQVALISLGDAVCSHANVLHGGINTTIIDEIGGGLAVRENPEPMMAVNFNVNLRKAVMVPGIIVVRAWMDRKSESRKIWVKCRIEQDGKTCIESESLYLKIDSAPKL